MFYVCFLFYVSCFCFVFKLTCFVLFISQRRNLSNSIRTDFLLDFQVNMIILKTFFQLEYFSSKIFHVRDGWLISKRAGFKFEKESKSVKGHKSGGKRH